MNCKKGELAFVIAGPSSGTVVQCLELYLGPWEGGIVGIPGWNIDRPILKKCGRKESVIADKWLRPILDPGEDATDEMVALLGKPASQPSKEHA